MSGEMQALDPTLSHCLRDGDGDGDDHPLFLLLVCVDHVREV